VVRKSFEGGKEPKGHGSESSKVFHCLPCPISSRLLKINCWHFIYIPPLRLQNLEMDSTYPDGALNAKSVGLYKARAGEVLGPPDHCFEIVGLNHTSENTPTALGQSIYIAKDLR
jgi:hypothetical protein